jgi:uncharacterized membrane protein
MSEKQGVRFMFSMVIGGVVFLIPIVVLVVVITRAMVFVPSPPNPFSGITPVLQPEDICYPDVSIKQIMEVTENSGHGVHEVLANKMQAEA